MASKTLRIVAVLLAGAAACAASSSSGASFPDEAWSTFAPPDCRCSVQFPGVPESAPSTVTTPIGQLAMTAYVLHAGDLAFWLTWSEMPMVIDRDHLEVVFQTSAESVGARPRRKRTADASSFPGLRADWRVAGETTELRVMMVGTRQYQLLVIAPDRAFDRETSAQFMASFKLVDPIDERRRADAQLDEQRARLDAAVTSSEALVARAREAPGGPTWLEAPDAHFRAWMPAGFESTTIDLAPGMTMTDYASVGEHATCVVRMFPNQPERDEAATRARLAGMVDRLVASSGLTAESVTRTDRHGLPALIVRAAGENMRAEIHATIGESRLFVLMATMDEGAAGDAEARRFLDSFEVLPAAKPGQR